MFHAIHRLFLALICALLSFTLLANLALAQSDGAPAEPAGKSYAMGYGAVVILLAVALILVCKGSGRQKDPPLHMEEE